MVLAPIVTQVGAAFGMDPVHLGIIFLANLELGYLTPLVGLNLFFASYRFGKPVRRNLPRGAAAVLSRSPWACSSLPMCRG